MIVIFERLPLHTTSTHTFSIQIGCCGVVSGLNGVVAAVGAGGVVDVATVGTVSGNGSVVVISVVGFAVDTEQHIMVTWSSRLV